VPEASTSLTIRALRNDDEPAVLALLETALAGGPTGSRTGDFLTWKHFANPFGRSIGLVAEDAGRVAGVRLVMRWQFELGGELVTAGRMVDTATHPEYRGRGIFKDLTLAALEIARDDTALIFNTPNSSSMPGYLKMGWQEVGTIATSIRAVRAGRMVVGARAALRRSQARPGRPLPEPDLPSAVDLLRHEGSDVEAVLSARHRDPSRLQTCGGVDYLRWRYAQVPGLDYRAVPVRDSGRLTGLGIGRLRRRGPLTEFTLSEVIHGSDDLSAARTILHEAAHSSGADHVATHVAPGTPTSRALLPRGYLTTRRVGLTLTTRPLRPLPLDVTDPDRWALTLGDVEVF
jgi:GNAT superfamily N-acetyltransferase